MKLIAHIVWKDLTRLRWWLVLWVVVLALPILDGVELILHCPLPLQHDHWSRPATHSGLVAIEIIVGFLIATLLWHEDRVTGASQFWTTRPISGGRLLVAKIVEAVTVLWGIPVLVSLPWWLWCGFTSHQVMLAALETAELAAAIGIPVAAVAAVTDTLVRTLIWTAVLIVATVPIFFTTLQGTHDMPLLGSRVLLILGLLLVEMLGLTALRFMWRLRWWPVGATAVVMIGSVWYARTAPWVWFDHPGEWRPERAAAVEVAFGGAEVRSMPTQVRSSEPQPITTYLWVTAPPTSPSTIPLFAAQKWIWPAGDGLMRQAGVRMNSTLDIEGFHRMTGRTNADVDSAPPSAILSARSVPRRVEAVIKAPLSATELAQFRRQPPGYAAKLLLAQVALHIAAETPLRGGRWQAHDGCGLRIDSFWRRGDSTSLKMVSTQPAPMADALLRWGWRGWLQGAFHSNLAVVNDRTHEYFWMNAMPYTLRVDGVEIALHSGTVNAGSEGRGNQWSPSEEWLTDANLAAVVVNTESIFAREVSVPKVVILESAK